MRYFLLLSLIIATSILCVAADSYQQTFSTPGTYSITIPANYAVKVSMWGAGGSGGYTNYQQYGTQVPYAGGSGAYVSCVVNALSGSTIYLLVGQGGRATSNFPSVTTNAIGGGGTVCNEISTSACFLVDNFIQFIHSLGYGRSAGGQWGASSGGGRSSIQFTSGVDAIVAGGGGGGGSCLSDIGCIYGTLGTECMKDCRVLKAIILYAYNIFMSM